MLRVWGLQHTVQYTVPSLVPRPLPIFIFSTTVSLYQALQPNVSKIESIALLVWSTVHIRPYLLLSKGSLLGTFCCFDAHYFRGDAVYNENTMKALVSSIIHSSFCFHRKLKPVPCASFWLLDQTSRYVFCTPVHISLTSRTLCQKKKGLATL